MDVSQIWLNGIHIYIYICIYIYIYIYDYRKTLYSVPVLKTKKLECPQFDTQIPRIRNNIKSCKITGLIVDTPMMVK